MEIMDVYAYRKLLAQPALADSSGTFSSVSGDFHMQQTGDQVNGCSTGHATGLIKTGGFDGRVLDFTWSEAADDGCPRHEDPAMLTLPTMASRSQASGGTTELRPAWGGRWQGTRTSRTLVHALIGNSRGAATRSKRN